MSTMRMLIVSSVSFSLALLLCLAVAPGLALAAGKPALSETLSAGPYMVVVNLFQNPPIIGQPLDITVVSQNNAQLSGRITAQPGLGTDAIPAHANLTPDTQAPGTLTGTLTLQVRGAWHLIFDLNGPQGHGSTSLDVIVAAPNAIPPWLGWLIGLSPLVGCAWLIQQQWRYRRRLVAATSLAETPHASSPAKNLTTSDPC